MRFVVFVVAAAVFMAVARAAIIALILVLLVALVHALANRPKEIFGFIAVLAGLRLIMDHPVVFMCLATAVMVVTKIFAPQD